jgi:hypothetical protein
MASFTEILGMTYNEVLHTPYRLMLMMQHDKIRVDYGDGGDTEVKATGKEMLKRKKAERR